MCDGVRLHAESGTRRRPPFVRQDQTRRPQVVMIVMPTVMIIPCKRARFFTKSPAPKKKKP